MPGLPNLERGACHRCGDGNRYTTTHSSRCRTRLAWAFLIDGIDDTPTPSTFDKWVARAFPFLGNDNAKCRYCGAKIIAGARVCPHCHKFLAIGGALTDGNSRTGTGTIVDQDAPELKALVQKFLADLDRGRETP